MGQEVTITNVRDDQHGSWAGYAYGCRCDRCRDAGREYRRARKLGLPTPSSVLTPTNHGTLECYARGCRSNACRGAYAAAHSQQFPDPGDDVVIRRYRYRIDPTAEFEMSMRRVFGGARFAYNAYIALARDAFASGRPHPSGFDGAKAIVTAGRVNEETAWMQELPSGVLRASVMHAAGAYQNFFNSLSGRRRGPKMGHPKFKRRSSRQVATFSSSQFTVKPGSRLRLAKVGTVSVNWHRELPSAPSSVSITKESDGRWFASFVVNVPVRRTTPTRNRVAGVDVGLNHFVTIAYSDGTREKVDNPRFLRRDELKLIAAQKNLSRKVKGGKNREKARKRLARVHSRIANRRADFVRQLAARLIRENQAVGVEQLNIAGLARTRMAKSINDAGWGEFLSALNSRAELHARPVVEAPAFYPSTRVCSLCGTNGGSKPLNIREWTCDCGARLDRDYNAATNLMLLALHSTSAPQPQASGMEVTACGRDVRRRLALASDAVADEAGTHPVHLSRKRRTRVQRRRTAAVGGRTQEPNRAERII